MRKFIKIFGFALIGAGVLVALVAAGSFFLMIRNTEHVRTMCNIPEGVDLEIVMMKARNLGFSRGGYWALPSGWLVKDAEGEFIEWDDYTLPGFVSGTVMLAKVSLPPFMRNHCELTFENRKVVSKRTWTLD